MEDEVSVTEETRREVPREQREVLYNRVDELKCSNAALLAEIDMFDRFIGRIDPRDMVSHAGGDGPAAAGASRLEGWVCGRRSNISEPLQQLTMEQKLYVAKREVKETRQDREKLRKRYERIQDNHKASLKEAELRLAEIQKAKKTFESKLLKPTKDNRLELKEPEKVLRYIEDKSTVAQLEKFHLKNRTLKAHEKKLQQQLQQKKETGKAEYEDIFQEYSEQTIVKDLEELKVNKSKVLRILGSQKEELQRATREAAELSIDITNRKQMLANIEEKIQHAEEEHLKAEALNQHLHRQLTDHQAPDITEYIRVKDKHKKLQRSIHTWDKKSEIAEMALKTTTWSAQRATLTPADGAEAGARTGRNQITVKLPHIVQNCK